MPTMTAEHFSTGLTFLLPLLCFEALCLVLLLQLPFLLMIYEAIAFRMGHSYFACYPCCCSQQTYKLNYAAISAREGIWKDLVYTHGLDGWLEA